MTWFGYPEAMKQPPMSPKIAPTGPILDAEDFRRRFPDGRIGSDPTLATPEHGGRFVETAVRDISEDYRRFLSQD